MWKDDTSYQWTRFMTMKNTSIVVFCLAMLMPSMLYGQRSGSVADIISPDEYGEIDGSPYLYEDWQKAEIISAGGKVYIEAKVNFNAYTQKVEYYKGTEIEEMIEGSYLKVSFLTSEGRQELIRGMHPEFGMDLICILFDGQTVDLAKKIVVTVDNYNTPEERVSKFVSNIDYYLIKNGRLNNISLKKKKILNVLKDNSAALEEYIDENDLKLKKASEVIQLLEYYESIVN